MPWGLSSSWGSNFPMVLPFDGKKNGWRFAVILCPFPLWPSERQKWPSERFISSLVYLSSGAPEALRAPLWALPAALAAVLSHVSIESRSEPWPRCPPSELIGYLFPLQPLLNPQRGNETDFYIWDSVNPSPYYPALILKGL